MKFLTSKRFRLTTSYKLGKNSCQPRGQGCRWFLHTDLSSNYVDDQTIVQLRLASTQQYVCVHSAGSDESIFIFLTQRYGTNTNVVCNWCSWNDKKCFYKRGFYISAQFSKSKTVEKSVWFRFKSLRWDRGKLALSNGWPRSKDLGTKLAVIEDIIQMATDYKRLITAFTTYLDDYWAVKSLLTVQTTDI